MYFLSPDVAAPVEGQQRLLAVRGKVNVAHDDQAVAALVHNLLGEEGPPGALYGHAQDPAGAGGFGV